MEYMLYILYNMYIFFLNFNLSQDLNGRKPKIIYSSVCWEEVERLFCLWGQMKRARENN